MASHDYEVNIAGVRPPVRRILGEPVSRLHGRPWLAVKWACCGAYTRIYRNAEGTSYEGRCPRCNRAVKVRVGPGGTNDRFFVAR
jgi:hypothetical protein